MESICNDLKDEYSELLKIVCGINEAQWDIITPFCDWTIRDEISHLMFGDKVALFSAEEPEKFKLQAKESMEDIDKFFEEPLIYGRSITTQSLLKEWELISKKLVSILLKIEPKTKLPWYGPSMNARSFATARIMETYAHGQDIYDALGINRKPTDRLKHVAHLGIRTFGWAFIIRKMEVPKEQVRVELKSPSSNMWCWGPEDAADIVNGTAEDFCLTVAQRRNVLDTELRIKGDVAKKWMSIAQVFAGPPADPPKPGEYLQHITKK